MNIWPLIGGLISLAALILWVKWLRTPSSATWPQGYLRSTLLHGIPALLGGLSVVFLMKFAAGAGVPEGVITGVAALPILVIVLLALLVILVYAGVPAPPFFIPAWIRKQDREWRSQRKSAKRRRAQERTAAQKARQRGK